jgi:hypothetical protein
MVAHTWSLVLLVVLLGTAVAQVPEQFPRRKVHPSIAVPVPGAILNGTSPYFQYPDGLWNHGEGFRLAPLSDADSGGWFSEDSGTGVGGGDIHTDPQDALAPTNSWSTMVWTDALHPNSPATLRRFYGYLRPQGLALPTHHPLYGNVTSAMAGYVDQGAFEMFCPTIGPDPTDTIVICIQTRETAPFPGRAWSQIYRGFFSPDGLSRVQNGTSLAGFAANTAVSAAERPSQEFLANWYALPAAQQTYWPITFCPVLTVGGREATLNEQRYMQVLEAVKTLLQENSLRNPLGAGNQLTPEQVVQRVVVIAAGGSNGCTQAMFLAMRYPTRVHGFYGEDYNPSTQRLFGEHDVDNVIAYLSGAPNPSQVTASDFMSWGKWASDQGLWIHDTSYSRRFLRGQTHRPACFMVGDEDITSTGDDWIRVMDGTSWTPVGEVGVSGQLLNHTFAWMSGENACHGTAAVPHPYVSGNPITFHPKDAIDGLARRAIATRALELPNPAVTLPLPGREDRIPGQQLRGPDDPHEWALGRAGQAMPAATAGPIHRDDSWFGAVQPGAAGTWLGHKESMFIRQQKVYVAGAEGVVSSFQVASTAKQELVRVAQTHDANGKPMSLGTEAFGLAPLDAGGTWSVAVATRRHLYLLHKDSLAGTAGPVELPWEVGRPHHMKVSDVLQGPSHSGSEIVFASTHGGLVFFSASLTPIWEWYEPGIVDFLVEGSTVTLMSIRGVVATVQFVWNVSTNAYDPKLHYCSRPIAQAVGDPPCQGQPSDIEWIQVDWTAFGGGMQKFPVGLWNFDEDGAAARLHVSTVTLSLVSNPGQIPGLDIATCVSATTPPGGNETPIGDHLLMLTPGKLWLYNQFGQRVAEKILGITAQAAVDGTGYYPATTGANAMVVGDLVAGGGSPGPYPEEIVLATTTGSLVWMHVNDLLTPTTLLPAPQPSGGTHVEGYWTHVANVGATNTETQPRTNRCLSASWALSRRAGDNLLHVLDQRGAYWQVGGSGSVALWERDNAALSARGWDDLGNRNASGNPIPLVSPLVQPGHISFPSPGLTNAQLLHTTPWLPELPQFALYERSPGHPFVANNWRAEPNPASTLFEGFVRHKWGGGLIDAPSGREVWFWSAREQALKQGWGDVVEAMRVTTSSWSIDGLWASTGMAGVTKPGPASLVPWHNLRSFTSSTTIMTQQAIQPVVLPGGQVAVILGCPGGRVRVIQPGAMLSPSVASHGLGSLQSTADLGYGGCALATRNEGSSVRIWFGTLYGQARRPQTYNSSTATLGHGEVATGTVYTCTWSPSGFTALASMPLEPFGITTRGGHAVVGLAVGDIIPSATHAGDELVVGTLGGDLVFLDPVTLAYVWHTHVPGSIGHFNSIRIANLDNDPYAELYASGSLGIWRFIHPMENNQ